MTASLRRSRLDGARLVAAEARLVRLHSNTMAVTPRQRRLNGCGLTMIKGLLKQMMSNTETIVTESGD
jgi:hypothetical protein